MNATSSPVDLNQILKALRESRAFLCTVESCTGGMISSRITDIPGSSEVFWGSFVTYENSAKEQLGVERELISRHGAVSQEVAQALAEAGLKRLMEAMPAGKRICVSTTGIAGPGGGTAEKPVGLCYVAIAMQGSETVIRRIQAMPGSAREQNKSHFTEQALSLLLESLEQRRAAPEAG